MSEEIALFIDFENIRYSMLNIQRREPDPQELIAVARRYGTVMVARAYADWTRQPEPFKGSLMAAMIDRVDCPAKQRDRIRPGTGHLPAVSAHSNPSGPLGPLGEQALTRTWPNSSGGNTGALPVVHAPNPSTGSDWPPYQDPPLPLQNDLDDAFLPADEYSSTEEETDFTPRDTARHNHVFQQPFPQGGMHSGPLSQNNTSPLAPPVTQHIGNTGHLPAISPAGSGSGPVVQSTVVQSTVDLNMLMDIIETVFDRPNISTFVLMTGDKDFTRISARLKLRLNKTVIVVGIPGTVSRDLISSANQFVPLVPGAPISAIGLPPAPNGGAIPYVSSGNTGALPAVSPLPPPSQFQAYGNPPIEALDPPFLQFLDYIDRNWSWRTVIGVANFIGDPLNPKNRFRGRLTRESARELLNTCIQQNILLIQVDSTGAEDLRLNRGHPIVDEVLKQFVR